MSEIYYNDTVKQAMKKLSTSTNVLEDYDNFTYNITLYMYDYETELKIENDIKSNGYISNTYDGEKIIIAKSGVTVNFVIDSLLIKTIYGNINSPINIRAFEMNLKIKEPMGANFTNALDIASKALGYPTHLGRPYWIDIYFTGYKHKTLERVEKIPLDGNLDTLTYRGMFGDVKSKVDKLGTEWNINFVPIAQKLTNKNNNYLSMTSVLKENRNSNLADLLERITELMRDDYIKTFSSESDREAVKSYLNSNKYITIKYKFNDVANINNANNANNAQNDNIGGVAGQQAGEYYGEQTGATMGSALGGVPGGVAGGIAGKIVGGELGRKGGNKIVEKLGGVLGISGIASIGGLSLESISDPHTAKAKKIIVDPNTSNDDTLNDTTEIKASQTEYFTTFVQKLLSKVKNEDKAYKVSFNINTKTEKIKDNLEVDTHNVLISFYKDPIIKESLKETSNYDEASKVYLNESIENKSLFKKYIFGFSGIDTSVLEIYNNFDTLWFTQSIEDSVEKFKKTNINLMKSTQKNSDKKNKKENNDNKDNLPAGDNSENSPYNGVLKIKNSENISPYNFSNIYNQNFNFGNNNSGVYTDAINQAINVSSIDYSNKSSSEKSSSNNSIGSVSDISSSISNSLKKVKSYLKNNNYVEDMFYDNYEEYIKNISEELRIDVPEKNNKLNANESRLASSSEKKEYDMQAIISNAMFNKLYKSGQLSTTKFSIIGDPYWLIPTCTLRTDDNLEISNVKNEIPGSELYKCVFELRTFYKQVKNYKNQEAGYVNEIQTLGADYAMNDSLNISGIYIISECETKLEDGKFIQTLEGFLDPHFFSSF